MIKKRFISMLVLLAAVVTGAVAQEETLLTTIESTGDNASFKSGSKTFDNIATVTFSGDVSNDDDDWGWFSEEERTLTVTAAEGYTITRVKFYNDEGSAFDEEAPFEAILVTENHDFITKVNGTSIGQIGVTKIEVYGYAGTPAPAGYTVTLKEGTEDATSWTIAPAEATTTGVAAGTEVKATYGGTKKVKSVKAKKKAVPATTDLSTISADYEAKNGETLTGTLANNVKISIADGATVTLKNVNITNLGNVCNWAGINCPGDATLVLEGTNEVCAGRGGDYGMSLYPGIWIAPNKTLTIQGAGNLTAYSGGPYPDYPYSAGIGGGFRIPCGNIVINSGTITATGGLDAAGIGAGGGTVSGTVSCGNITINGGTVEATGGGNGAGIGGGYGNACGNITISGGTVSATGGDSAAGIGGGRSNGACGTITIKSTVTSVTATKGSAAPNSIGSGGENGTAITVTIEDGANVTQN